MRLGIVFRSTAGKSRFCPELLLVEEDDVRALTSQPNAMRCRSRAHATLEHARKATSLVPPRRVNSASGMYYIHTKHDPEYFRSNSSACAVWQGNRKGEYIPGYSGLTNRTIFPTPPSNNLRHPYVCQTPTRRVVEWAAGPPYYGIRQKGKAAVCLA